MPASRILPAAPDPLEPLWRGRALVWTLLVAEGLAIVLALAPGLTQDRAVYFGLASMMALWIALLPLATLYLLRRRLAAWPLQRLAWFGLGLLMASSTLVGLGSWLLLRPLWAIAGQSLAGLMLSLTGIVATVGLLTLAGLQNYWKAQHLARRAQQAELAALHARIHPHFLFNTLNTAIALVRARPDAAEQVLLDLADLFRVALGAPREIPLRAELELARRYLDIEQLRLGARLRVDWNVPERLPEVGVPALSIQPLIENAVRHGVERRAEGGAIEVAAAVGAERVRITVRNPLPAEGAPEAPGHRIGQSAVRARLEASGTGGRLETRDDGTSYTAVLTLPLDGGDQASTR